MVDCLVRAKATDFLALAHEPTEKYNNRTQEKIRVLSTAVSGRLESDDRFSFFNARPLLVQRQLAVWPGMQPE